MTFWLKTAPVIIPLQVIESPHVKRAITMNVTEPMVPILILKKTASEMWNYLYETNSGENRSRMFAGIKKLASISYGKGSMQENLKL